MMYDAEDKYADIIRLPSLFFKKCENRPKNNAEKCENQHHESRKNVKIIDSSL